MKLLSVHVPKTGGTTFLHQLRKDFGPSLFLDYDVPRETILRAIDGARRYCVHGHFLAVKYADLDAQYVAWVREPIDRLISYYNFWRNYRYPNSEIWRRFHFDAWDFQTFALSPFFKNEQTKYISGIGLDRYAFIGVTEFYEECLNLFSQELGAKVDLGAVAQYRNGEREAVHFKREMLSKRDTAIIVEYHAEDYNLYQAALRTLKERTTTKKGASKPGGTRPAAQEIGWGPRITGPASRQAALAWRRVVGERIEKSGVGLLRGTYFYGDGWPIALWDSFRAEVVDVCLRKAVENNYNMILLLIPAGLSLIKDRRPDFYSKFKEDLLLTISKIRSAGLLYGFRVSYAWDGYPLDKDRGVHVFDILVGGTARKSYMAVLSELWDIVEHDESFLLAFLTWEDLLSFPIIRAPQLNAEGRKRISEQIGYQPVIPRPDSPDFQEYLNFLDSKLSELFYDFKSVFAALTVEVRLDGTPFTDASGQTQWFIHERQFVEIDSDVIGTYFGTYFMQGELPRTAEQAMDALRLSHRNLLAASQGQKIFLDQFNFVMKERNFASFPPLEAGELRRFLQGVGEWFEDHSVGYATWSYIDYLKDMISNSAFRLGLEGWKPTGDPLLVEQDGCRFVELQDGDRLAGTNIKHYSGWIRDGWLMIECQLDEGAVLRVELGSELEVVLKPSDFKRAPYGVFDRAVVPFKGKTSTIAVTAKGGRARIARISMGDDICSNGGLTVQLQPTEISQIVAEFNSEISKRKRSMDPRGA